MLLSDKHSISTSSLHHAYQYLSWKRGRVLIPDEVQVFTPGKKREVFLRRQQAFEPSQTVLNTRRPLWLAT